ncbi:MAG TPA: hypothetical protein VFY02_00215 [Gaiellaceae bacterium]|nr:hypothetical protein [Gaiellaceae bacterium]
MTVRLGWLLVGVLAGAALLAIPWESTSDAGTGPAIVRITDRQLTQKRVDLGPRGTSPGDLEIVRHRLFDRTRSVIGRSELVCTFVDNRRSRSCRGTYILPRGKIVVGGSLQYHQFYVLAVTGGTGLFDNARGTVTVTRTARRPVRDLVVIRLAG